MKKYAISLLLGLQLLTASAYADIPDKIILHNTAGRETMTDVLFSQVKPKIQLSLHESPSESSPIIASISAGKAYDIAAHEIHVNPKLNALDTGGGKIIYVLAYAGEGMYKIYYNNQIKEISIPEKVKIKNEYWLCLCAENGIEGWTKFTKDSDYVLNDKFGLIYHPKY